MNIMSSSTLNIQPSLLDNRHSRDRRWTPADDGAHEQPSPQTASFTTTSFAASTLSPYSHAASNSASPINYASTPADSAFSEQYPSSDFSDNRDPFFGVELDDIEGTPSFLGEDPIVSIEDSSDISEPYPQTVYSAPTHNAHEPLTYPISPGPAPSSHTTFTRAEHMSLTVLGQVSLESLSHAPSKTSRCVPSDFTYSQLTPQSTSDWTNTTVSSEECPTSTAAPKPSPSPRVTVSMWGWDKAHEGDSFHRDNESPATVRAGGMSASYQPTSGRDGQAWTTRFTGGRSGWDPESRLATEGASMDDLEAQRKIAERNEEVDRWMTMYESGGHPDEPPTPRDPLTAEEDGIYQRDVPRGDQTENKPLPGQTYYNERGGPLTEDDWTLMRQHRAWADAPTLYPIDNSQRTQPETAQAAMQRFEDMCQETGSVLSRAATWGTRRRSLPSIADMDGVTSGNLLKKLSITRERKPSIILKELQNRLMRKPSTSQLLKRHRSVPEDEVVEQNQMPQGRRNTLAPPGRTTSWARKPAMPSLNTALVSMATGAAAIGTTHARTSSISHAPSPKSPFFHVRRPRSRSELPKNYNEESPSLLAGMWKKSGGPPVARLARSSSAPELDDDEDDDDDPGEEDDARAGASNFIDGLTPNLAGFKQQVLQMNPMLAEQNNYLVERIAHQQVVRFKDLLNKRVTHMQQTNAHVCPSGLLCVAAGGSARIFAVKGESRGVDPLATNYEGGSDAEGMPVEGAITAESFPSDIPMPPTTALPAEFECQLCYSTKRFTKPSDWTKHVHEDVQPFTCTWDRCREPKIFKRKADWVRHENEGHRHLEWWMCDVEDCRHTCYRRDNFLQHLVREHKFPEPKVKTKAAVKRAGAHDITWQKVEKCHKDTPHKPQDEPCRFCGKTLQTWKKLTVHLAKHMENMSLPILRLVALKELNADTIISPVQEPPPRSFPPFPPTKSESHSFSISPSPGRSPAIHQGGLAYPGAAHPPYPQYPTDAFSNLYDPNMQGLQQPSTLNLGLHQPEASTGFTSQTGYHNLPGSTGGYMGNSQYNTMAQQLEPFPAFTNPLGLQDTSGNQIYHTNLNPPNYGGDQQQYSHQGSASPYSRSPHQSQGGFYH